MKTLRTGLLGLMLAAAAATACGQSTIGAPDGISYRVISSRQEVVMDAGHCGYHDLSLPNGAVYRLETRFYSEYDKGQLVRTWTEKDVPVFVRCDAL
jgi:hypothetical protein